MKADRGYSKKSHRPDRKSFSLLGTENWESYALMQAGVTWKMRGDREQARQLLQAALQKDPGNRGALVNLGAMDLEDGSLNAAHEKLEEARRLAEISNSYDSDLFTALYQLTIYHEMLFAGIYEQDNALQSLLGYFEKDTDDERLERKIQDIEDNLQEIDNLLSIQDDVELKNIDWKGIELRRHSYDKAYELYDQSRKSSSPLYLTVSADRYFKYAHDLIPESKPRELQFFEQVIQAMDIEYDAWNRKNELGKSPIAAIYQSILISLVNDVLRAEQYSMEISDHAEDLDKHLDDISKAISYAQTRMDQAELETAKQKKIAHEVVDDLNLALDR